MLRATSVLRKPAVRADRVVDTLSLGHRDRSLDGVTVTAEGGLEFAISLDKPTSFNDGDALKLEDGRLVQVKAAPEKLLEVRAENPLRLVRLAWHLGGHHVPAEMTADALYVPADPSLAELVRGQGCAMAEVERPFQPEPEVHHHAHGDDCGCGHDHHHHDHHHGHDHGHGHHHEHHGHDHAHGHKHDHDHKHAHGEGCGCGHDHDHHGHGHHDHGHGHGAAHGHKGHSHDH
ncbi:urease accessory protein UreE [Bosea thiooxidans]|uniref:Urease accessory protein UreE n=1 Tax=Bosea thiooxidans TaxID=53254 RepID=A0A0Q3HZ59_9HYPH|nr:urease accessory protein UreE [Bosea thiooxidans]KQK28032.1 urease accessory protein UreE [Bosea thiooxidans]SKB88284.1 urease accessory protein [Bosea thiooxidans]